MKKVFLLFFSLFFSVCVFGQEHQAVATKMDKARFEVIQNRNSHSTKDNVFPIS